MNEFDIKAAEWDSNPMHWERSEAIAKEIRNIIPLNKDMSALEFGAGTGITSFILKDFVKTITMMDTSAEMIRVIHDKIRTTKTLNLKALYFDLENRDYREEKFDLVFTQMVLHHIADTEAIVSRFSNLLNIGGYLAIADLYEEDGSFHGEGFTGHNGFNIDALSGILQKCGFSEVSNKTCYVIERKISETESKKFKVFLITATLIQNNL
jgi:tRNA (cmo5U34)-methyltransferase